MKKQFSACLLAASIFCGVANAQTNIEWTVAQGSLAGVIGGIQMHGSAAIQVNGQMMLYAIGGNRSVDGGDSVHISYAPINFNPVTVGTWTNTTYTFPEGSVSGFASDSTYIERKCFGYNGRLYVVGGDNNGSDPALNKIRVFEIQSSGDILAEATALGFDGASAGTTPDLGTFGTSVVVNPATGDFYVLGGISNLDVQHFKINPTTGAVGNYQLYPGKLVNTAYVSPGAVIRNGYIYVLDSNNAADRGKVQYAAINPDGTLGSFSATTALPTPHIDGGAALLQGEIYVVAGHSGSGNAGVTNTVHRAQVAPNGSITSWITEPPFPNADAESPAGLRRVGVASMGNLGFAIIGGRNVNSFPQHVFVATPTVSSVNEWTLY